MTEQELIKQAVCAMTLAYAPYSGCTVGAALLAESGRVFLGVNIENASYSATVCAERTALFKAISEGERRFSLLAVAGGKGGQLQDGFPPCGVCRQALSEFCPPEMPVLVVRQNGEFDRYTLGQLLPAAFGSAHLK